eukprot:TRINITY_DN12344_c0_g3_i1.p1 TRINITY_DN12344_c0_g3~~TRINITY_DN12344_c0_g3_i1.p1  ORF type:complete len:1092 (+),score=215.04 TRINITY_DN12344_c0_g3_i1:174-3449(+)
MSSARKSKKRSRSRARGSSSESTIARWNKKDKDKQAKARSSSAASKGGAFTSSWRKSDRQRSASPIGEVKVDHYHPIVPAGTTHVPTLGRSAYEAMPIADCIVQWWREDAGFMCAVQADDFLEPLYEHSKSAAYGLVTEKKIVDCCTEDWIDCYRIGVAPPGKFGGMRFAASASKKDVRLQVLGLAAIAGAAALAKQKGDNSLADSNLAAYHPKLPCFVRAALLRHPVFDPSLGGFPATSLSLPIGNGFPVGSAFPFQGHDNKLLDAQKTAAAQEIRANFAERALKESQEAENEFRDRVASLTNDIDELHNKLDESEKQCKLAQKEALEIAAREATRRQQILKLEERLQTAEAECRAAQAEGSDSMAREISLTEEVRELEERVQVAEKAVKLAQSITCDTRSREAALEEDVCVLEARAQAAEQALESERITFREISASSAKLRQHVADLEKRLDDVGKESALAERAANETTSRDTDMRQQFAELEERVRAAEREAEKAHEETLEIAAGEADCKNELAEMNKKLFASDREAELARVKALEAGAREAACKAQIASLEEKLMAAGTLSDRAQTITLEAETREAKLKEDLAERKLQAENIRKQVSEQQERISFLEGQLFVISASQQKAEKQAREAEVKAQTFEIAEKSTRQALQSSKDHEGTAQDRLRTLESKLLLAEAREEAEVSRLSKAMEAATASKEAAIKEWQAAKVQEGVLLGEITGLKADKERLEIAVQDAYQTSRTAQVQAETASKQSKEAKETLNALQEQLAAATAEAAAATAAATAAEAASDEHARSSLTTTDGVTCSSWLRAADSSLMDSMVKEYGQLSVETLTPYSVMADPYGLGCGHLILGNAEFAKDLKRLQEIRVRYILNLCIASERDCVKPIMYMRAGIRDICRVVLDDSVSANLVEKLPEALAKIDEWTEQAKRDSSYILVHCHAGINRSAAVVVAWTMRKLASRQRESRGMDLLEQAWRLVAEKRWPVLRNPSFRLQLVIWGECGFNAERTMRHHIWPLVIFRCFVFSAFHGVAKQKNILLDDKDREKKFLKYVERILIKEGKDREPYRDAFKLVTLEQISRVSRASKEYLEQKYPSA